MNTFIGSGTISLLGFLGAVVILLWGVRMVRKGAEALILPHINTSSPIFNNRILALLAGIGGAALLQSSTAMVLIVSSIATKITIPLTIGLSFVLGAGVGTSLAAQLFTFSIKSLGPFLLLVGFLMLRATHKKNISQNIGRMLMGFGFILYALTTIGDISQSIRDSVILNEMLSSVLINDMALALLISILLTWMSHSSLAVILLTFELVGNQLVPLELGVALVLGTNIGACLPAYTGSLGLPVEARRLTLGNVVFRMFGGICFLVFMRYIIALANYLPLESQQFLAMLHLAFNTSIVVIFIFFLKPVEKFILKLLPEPLYLSHKDIKTKFLHTDDIHNTDLAITNLVKEVFRMSDHVYIMTDQALRALDDSELLLGIKKTEKTLDSLHRSITKYLQKLYACSLDKQTTFSAMLIHAYCTDLEQIGDIIESSLYESLENKHKKHLQISLDYKKQIEQLFEILKENIVLSQEIFRGQDIEKCHELITRKHDFKKEIMNMSLLHKQKILEGEAESVAINSIYLDIVLDLRRINAHITMIAYSIIKQKEATLVFPDIDVSQKS